MKGSTGLEISDGKRSHVRKMSVSADSDMSGRFSIGTVISFVLFHDNYDHYLSYRYYYLFHDYHFYYSTALLAPRDFGDSWTFPCGGVLHVLWGLGFRPLLGGSAGLDKYIRSSFKSHNNPSSDSTY